MRDKSMPVRILFLEDNPDDAKLCLHELRHAGFEPTWDRVETRQEFLDRIARMPYDVVLANYRLPQFTGLEALELLQQRRPDVPLIVVTGTLDEETAVDCIRQGAANYVLKENLARLGPAVSQALETHKEREREKEKRRRVEEALPESEARYHLLMENANDAIYTLDSDLHITDVNPYVEQAIGYSRDELIGRSFPELGVVAPASIGPAIKDAARVLAGERVSGAVCEFITKDGRHLFGEVSAAPICREGRVVGLFTITRDITERRRAEEEIKRRSEELEALAEVGRAISSTLDLGQVLEAIATHATTISHSDAGGIFELDEMKGILRITASYNASQEFVRAVNEAGVRIGEGTIGRAVVTREPVQVVDTETEGGYRFREISAIDGIRSILAVPVFKGEELLGGVMLWRRKPGPFSSRDMALLTTLADQAAIAIENARLYQETHRRAERLAVVNHIAHAASATLHLDDLMETVYQEVAPLFQTDAFFIALYDQQAGELDFRLLVDKGVREPLQRLPLEPGLTALVVTRKKPLLIQNLDEERERLPLPKMWGTMKVPPSWLGVPMRIGERVVGVICVQAYRPHAYGEEEQLLLSTIADQVAVAVEKARLYGELRNHAGELEERVQERTAQVQAQYARLEAILRSTSDGIIVTDARGEIIQANPVAQTWLTRTLSPEDAAYLRETVRDMAGRAEERPETVLELAGLDLQLNAAPISEPGMEEALRPAQGKPAAVTAVHDVSYLKAMDRLKSRFVSNVSHELRTPVTTIKLYAALMRRRPEKWEKYLDTLEREAERQARLVEDILQISRADAGRLEIESRPTPLNELTEVAVASHQVLARERGLTLGHQPAELGPVALVDPEQTMQVLNNLVRNAIQYTQEGGRVVVSTGKEEAEGRVWATMTVADTGMGIPEEELPHIFDRFFRGEEPRLMQSPGTGLGLAIVNEIVELHEGRVTVESHVGEGTTFTLFLPMTETS